MLPEVKAEETRLKQILYGCVEHIQATKAALYLASTPDLNDKLYELVTSYQFHDPERKVVKESDEVVDRLVTRRNAFYINGLGADSKFSEILFRQSTDRMLAAPIYSRGRLVGFIDMRDKAAKKEFADGDLRAAKRIVDEVLQFLSSKKLYGVGPVQLVHEPTPRAESLRAAPQNAATSAAPTVAATNRADHAIESAREAMSRRQHITTTVKRTASPRDADAFRLLLPSALAIPGAVMAAVSLHGSEENPLAIVAKAAVTEDAMIRLEDHLRSMLQEANEPHEVVRRAVAYPFGQQPIPITDTSLSAMATVAVAPKQLVGLLLTVGFERTAEQDAERAAQSFLRQMDIAVEAGVSVSGGRVDRITLAEMLIEPDFERHPELLAHCQEVANVAATFATRLGLSAIQIETIRVAALVHDAGLRLLDFDRYFQKKLSPEEMRTFQEHPTIGAALIEPLFGSDVAQAVLRHHERMDGNGYPSRLPANQIPLASKVIQIADAWVAMTSPSSYQARCPASEAAGRLREAAGTQFDQALVAKFLEAPPSIDE
ncbi:MAG TPA: HD domain-containing phosphohydrolase [Thermoanaerobaculia bacterium]|nr:HD domain-containing phosphohydrolase [Thermoanaerobaculia bacterium]